MPMGAPIDLGPITSPEVQVSDAAIVMAKLQQANFAANGATYRVLRQTAARFVEKMRIDPTNVAPRHFNAILGEAKVFLTAAEQSRLCRAFFHGEAYSSADPAVDLTQFIPACVAAPSQKRMTIIQSVWMNSNFFIDGASESADLMEVVEAYTYEAHPWVMNQKGTVDELKNALLADLSELNDNGERLSVEHFLNYAVELASGTQTSDATFVGVMQGFCNAGFKIVSDEAERIQKVVDLMVEKFIQRNLISAPIRESIAKSFNYVAASGESSDALNPPQFHALLELLGVAVSAADEKITFMFLGGKNKGRVEYRTFLNYFAFLIREDSTKIRESHEAEVAFQSAKAAGPLSRDPDAAPVELMRRIRAHMLKYHPRGLSVVFNTLHSLNRVSDEVSKRDFGWGLRICGLKLGTAETAYIEKYFASNKTVNGEVGVDKNAFLHYLRATISAAKLGVSSTPTIDMAGYEARKAAVAAAVGRVLAANGPGIDVDGDGKYLAASFVKASYSVRGHADKKTDADKLKEEFFVYLGESLALGKAAVARIVLYLADETCAWSDEEFALFLFSCLPGSAPAAPGPAAEEAAPAPVAEGKAEVLELGDTLKSVAA